MITFFEKRIGRPTALPRYFRVDNGATLIELLVVVVIVGVLAAVGIPAFTTYIKNSRLSEAQVNIQGIIEAEQVYFTRFQRYTPSLPLCPPWPPNVGKNQLFDPTQCIGGVTSGGWIDLGWTPDGAVYFQYQVFSAYPLGYEQTPAAVLLTPANANAIGANANLFGVNWNQTVALPGLAQPLPWFAVEATADTDGDGNPVIMRSNSVNYKVVRFPDPTVNPTW